ncbi:inositol 2-dehydrogenase [Aureibacillus halotolerans]|uniref:Myo-inositol 2-dehydrogenase/D-chiro-inositol 1-dehydrogenase n=1 Tax=Aureibacillus halotolerans TaxID=1508390 RepID=A0A4R6U8C3_9BACI|nr:inositol 2-dehydrogenase [Aureibacillus halotolerans]TDQ41029.1 myo-inositol 2-dehydrogenase/D-chiro-inositol 1-dehydrogenase [Aureibacillus halotolerans]
MKKKVRLGIIGAGRIGQIHATNVLQSPQAELVVVSDVYFDSEVQARLHSYGVETTDDYLTVLRREDVDAVLVCSSTDTHIDMISEAAANGKHVFCEKPVSLETAKTKMAIAKAEAQGIALQIGFNRRFDPNVQEAKAQLEQGRIGALHSLRIISRDPAPPPAEYVARSGGLFKDMAIHDLDMARYLTGKEVEEVYVRAACLVDPMFATHDDVDTATTVLTFTDGTFATIENSRRAVYGYDQRIELFGEKGMIQVGNQQESTVQISGEGHIESAKPQAFFLERYATSYRNELEQFLYAITFGGTVPCTGKDALVAEELADACRLSWKEKKPILFTARPNTSKG